MHKATGPCEIGVLLFENFSNHCLANAIEPLRAANTLAQGTLAQGAIARGAIARGQPREGDPAQGPLYRWRFLGLTTQTLRSSSGLPVTPEARLSDHQGDWLLILPSYDFEQHANPTTSRALRAAAKRHRRLIALDMGAWLLAEAGLLNGRRATLHWDELDRFAEAFPDVQVSEDRVVEDGAVLSCGGASTAFDLMMAQIAASHGPMLRLEVAALFMQDTRAVPAEPPRRRTDDTVVEAAMALMRRNIEAPLPVAAIARRLGMSPRALERHFAAALGQGPAGFYRALRLDAARRLVEQSALSVAEIATRTGYEDPAALTRAYRRSFGAPPRTARRARDGRA